VPAAKRTAKSSTAIAPPKPPAVPAPDFSPVFSALKPVLAKYSKHLFVRDDKPDNYYLETKSRSYQGERMFFAGLRVGKASVSFHLMPLYTHPELQKSVPAGLKRRMQGKSCFNFTAVEPELIALLGPLVAAGFKKFDDEKLL
jgi:hypothetical protein